MSSLFRFPRRSHHDHLKDELKNEHLAPVQSPRHAPSITESVRERRLSALSFISEKLSHKPKLRWPRTSTLGIGDGGIGHTVDFPRTYSRESTPSPTGSLEDIQIPAGLGRRASESGLQPPDTPTQENIFLATPSNSDQRNRTRSAPSTTTSRTVKRKSVPLLSEMDGIRTDEPAISRMPPELLASVFSFATRRDVLSLTHVSKGFSTAALRALYCRLDLRALSPERVDRCVSLLASNRDFASYVRDFACAALPPPDAALPAVTFAIAFTNMHALESLTLPDYDARFLMHTSFRLKRLRVMSEFASEDDWRSFWAWLAKQPELASLSFPHLLQNASECGLPDPPPRPAHDDVDDDDDTDTLHEDTFAQSLRLPSNYLPRLAHFHGPASLAAAVVPGRPVVSVTLHVHTTLYDGLKPSAVMSALTRSRASVKRLGISVSLMQVDARTLERVFMSAGAELGSQLDTLAVEWVLDDEVRAYALCVVTCIRPDAHLCTHMPGPV